MFLFDFRGLVGGLNADLAASSAMADVSQAAASQFQVDRAALYKHYFDVVDRWERLNKQSVSLQEDGAANSYPTSQIPGVQKALEASWDIAAGQSESMVGGLRSVVGQIANYANAIAAVYTAYVNADSNGTSTLTAVSNPYAVAINIPG